MPSPDSRYPVHVPREEIERDRVLRRSSTAAYVAIAGILLAGTMLAVPLANWVRVVGVAAGLAGLVAGPLLARRLYPLYPAGCCAVCGYDLRETPERCPECGMPAGM